jgi:hypothetical protein
MTEQDLSRIETALSISLPIEYREIMLATQYDYSADYWLAMCEMPDDADLIIKWNREFRQNGFSSMDKWPLNFFTFGQNGFGDHYFLQLDSCRVFCKWHETGEITEVASKLGSFIEDCLRKDEEATAVQQRLDRINPNRSKHSPIAIEEAVVIKKKWWQFWKRRIVHRRY